MMPTATAPYTVKKHKLTGKSTVHFSCAKCGATLNAPLEDAGAAQSCPECKCGIRVPGVSERMVQEAEDRASAAVAAREKADRDAESHRRQSAAASAAIATAVAERKKPPAPATFGMFVLGALLLLFGVVVTVSGMNMDTTIATSKEIGSFSIPDRVHNMGMMAQQTNTVLLGCALCIMGFICIAAGGIGQEIARRGNLIAERLERKV